MNDIESPKRFELNSGMAIELTEKGVMLANGIKLTIEDLREKLGRLPQQIAVNPENNTLYTFSDEYGRSVLHILPSNAVDQIVAEKQTS
jgi:hypothetical protein